MRHRRSYRRPHKSRFVEMFGDTFSNPMGWPSKTFKEAGKRNYAYVTEKNKDGRILLQTYNRFPGSSQEIWHIHGEARKPNSIVLGHLYYGNLLTRCSGYLYGDAGCEEGEVFSWVDAFMLGDVYTLGFGYDF